MNRLLSLKLLVIIILTFVSCSKDSDEPEPAETSVTTSDFSTTMDENPTNGQVIGAVQGSTNQGSISFSLIEQFPEGAFSIDPSTGELKVADETLFNFEVNPTIIGTVKVAQGTLFKMASVIINLNNLEEDRLYEGDIILTTQNEVIAFGNTGYTHITGSLLIGTSYYDDIVDLSPLLNVEKVENTLSINNCSNLITTAGLRNISYVGSGLVVYDNPVLKKITDLQNLAFLEGVLFISGNLSLNEISSFDQLTEIKGNFQLYDSSIKNLDAFVNLNSIEGFLTIYNNIYLNNINGLASLSAVGDHINISYNYYLTDLDGLSNLTTTLVGLEIYNNSSLENINGLHNIETTDRLFITSNYSLKNIEGLSSTKNVNRLKITQNNSLLNLQGLNNLTVIGEDGLYIEGNNKLTNLNGLNGINNIQGELSISENFLLRDFCILQDFLTNGSLGSYSVFGNFYNPTMQEIIDGNCNI
ncbi:cadherin repeat domain-containing protein [Aequorivita antarctica]|uniref:Cadherin repeat domain-containing protein n=1 Tax=Aequorivita antarctica TaxID=153266 RepID=A0A5C6YVC2_9FLAO|nr:cadherin repeat domain-containing protein [Aequorivita antarctica]TXD71514.1 cadherin repeat domain-containing protein [Aequorivita antarctica]SRX76069.1 hypothetical protein AEQU3_03067 [Aequorivita antarctica]